MVHLIKCRVTTMSDNGSRDIAYLTEEELQILRAKRLQKMRREELGLTQKLLAEAIGVKLRTLQDWEIGRSPMPKPVEILMQLMREMPEVKEKLLQATHLSCYSSPRKYSPLINFDQNDIALRQMLLDSLICIPRLATKCNTLSIR
ncbi:helix-turn-helix domain-containing protein [candidate division KSB1 bacterium]|nr:helix-turn-helix domain-containing protein [candidate division KSB1 bacterium]RQW05480.1 MAG: helix-turn-helix domain-containing protein [candidate division KSB1 bacterium]